MARGVVTFRKLSWFFQVFGTWQERYTDRLHASELALWRGARLGEYK